MTAHLASPWIQMPVHSGNILTGIPRNNALHPITLNSVKFNLKLMITVHNFFLFLRNESLNTIHLQSVLYYML
jgi:hypothetical protein